MKRGMLKRGFALALGLAMVLMLFPAMAAAQEKGVLDGYTVILHTNDTHGRIDDNLGFTAVAALKAKYVAAGANVLVFDVGDTLHGKPVVNLAQGENAVKILNAVGYDAFVPGNHDFNYGAKRLKELEKSMNFPMLAANVTQTGSDFAKDNLIIEKGGVKYGIFGLATPETAYKTNPNNLKGIRFEDPTSTAKAQVIALRARGADYIIALCHLGLEGEYTTDKLAKAVKGIDILIDGHSHTRLERGLIAGSTLIASTGEYLQSVGMVVIAPDGKMGATLVGEEFTATNATVDALVGGMLEQTEKQLNVVVGATTVELDGARETNRTSETNLGNLVADAMRDITGADIAMNNGGGIRATIPIGPVTKMQVLDVLPFGNFAVVTSISGADVLAALELGVKDYPEASGGYPQVSGITFEFDSAKPAGSRIVSAKVGGEALDPGKMYTFATNDFLSAGGDGYTMLQKAPILGMYPNLEEIVMDFIANNPDYVAVVEGRSVHTGAAADKAA